MLLRDYTRLELNHLIENCNFTESELQYFLLKSKDYSNVQISFEMNISEQQVSRLAKRVKQKINRIPSI
jgi:DNA-directed RNA polymerase specialized sigma subunit